MAESEEELKRLLMKVKKESEKVCLKLNIQKMKIVAPSPITSGQTDGQTVRPGCKHVRKQVDFPCVLKSRDITLPTKVQIVKAMIFPVVMNGCELDHKKAECHRIDAFKFWCWRRLLRVPWTARKSNQPILKRK